MVEDVTNQRVYRLVSTKNRFHLTKLFFALFNDIRICILRHNVIFCVDEMQCVLVQLEMNNTALIVNRSGRSIFDGLRHIINVNVITEHFTGAAVFGGNRSAGKSDISSVWQAVSDNSGCADDCFCFNLSIFFLLHNNLFSQAILPTVRFISHDEDISTLGEGFSTFLKLLHCCKDDAVCLPVRQQFL